MPFLKFSNGNEQILENSWHCLYVTCVLWKHIANEVSA